jgi:hypothetical protein
MKEGCSFGTAPSFNEDLPVGIDETIDVAIHDRQSFSATAHANPL